MLYENCNAVPLLDWSVWGLIRYFARRSSTWPPLNLALLAGIAEKYGHEVEIIDGEVEGYSNEQIVQEALSRNPELIAMTATSPFFHINKAVAELFKEKALRFRSPLVGRILPL